MEPGTVLNQVAFFYTKKTSLFLIVYDTAVGLINVFSEKRVFAVWLAEND